jgi:CDP-glycerol glycerophosphotransferase (TagB/SpsB family)
VVPSVARVPQLIHSASACNKIFRRSFLEESELRFGEGVHFEDAYVTIPALLAAQSIALTNALVYNYRKRDTGGSIMDSLFTRPQNFWDHLLLEEFLAGWLGLVDEENRSVLQSFMSRSFQGFALRAPEVFEADELGEFFDRASKVYRGFPAAVIQGATLDLRHRIAYAAFLSGDFELFADRSDRTRDLRAEEGKLILDGHADESLTPLLTLDRVHAWVESVTRQGRELVVSGRFHLPGVDLSVEPSFQVALRVRGSAITAPAVVVERRDLVPEAPTRAFSGFEARISLGRLRTGLHDLRLVVDTSSGQASTATTPTPGYLRAARVQSFPGGKVVPGVNDKDKCTLLVRRLRSRKDRLRWRALLARKDIAGLFRREPFAGEKVLRLLSRPFFRRRPVWLLGERKDTAQDNSAALFRYISSAHPEIRCYYVVDGESEAYGRMSQLGRVVAHSSFLHRLLMLHARVLVSAYDIDGYLLPRQWAKGQYHRHLAARVGSRRVFLQHGVIYNDVSRALHKGVTGLDLFVASSEREADFIRTHMGYGGELQVTGMPRFDQLARSHRLPRKRVLFMPTWRSYLVAPSYAPGRVAAQDFEQSQYLRFIRQLLEHPRLEALLREHDADLELLPHYEVSKYFLDHRDRLADHVIVSDQRDRDIQSALRECDVFITDWSSTFFDVAYLGTPMILVPHDEEDFYSHHYRRGYFDLERDGFGPIARTVEDALDRLADYLDGGCVREPVYDERAADFFRHTDQSNSERVTAAIAALP